MSDGGKGSTPRPFSVSYDIYGDNYDRIFGKKSPPRINESMTPQEIFEYKRKWLPGHTVKIHSDLSSRGKSWCKLRFKPHQWTVTEWTDIYEYTFHFELDSDADRFSSEVSQWVK